VICGKEGVASTNRKYSSGPSERSRKGVKFGRRVVIWSGGLMLGLKKKRKGVRQKGKRAFGCRKGIAREGGGRLVRTKKDNISGEGGARGGEGRTLIAAREKRGLATRFRAA